MNEVQPNRIGHICVTRNSPRDHKHSSGVPDARSNSVTWSGSDPSRIATTMSGASVELFLGNELYDHVDEHDQSQDGKPIQFD